MAATSTLEIRLFPSDPPGAPTGGVGLAFSGGGSRAMVAAMGQLRGLKALGLLDRFGAISSVSGGTWAAAAFSYLPAAIADDDFLGLPSPPAAISPESLLALTPNNLGRVAQNFGILGIAEVLAMCLEKHVEPWDYWQAVVGHCVLKPFGLWQVDAHSYPTKYYAASLQGAEAIVARNPALKLSDFYTPERPRPQLIMNGAMFRNPLVKTPPLKAVPFQSTPAGVGIDPLFVGQGPSGWDLGGGQIESVGMGSTFSKMAGGVAQVSLPARPFSLSDMASISSAAIADVVEKQLPAWLNELKLIVPRYAYWPVGGIRTNVDTYDFGDGGFLDNTGIAALLARGVRSVIAFVNTDTKLEQDSIDSQVSMLFGEPSQGANAEAGICLQVFEHKDLSPLVRGLWDASRHGPAMFLQKGLTTLANPDLGVRAGEVDVLWVLNSWVEAWFAALRPSVRAIVELERLASSFPYYGTVTRLHLTPTQVNLLAHLSCWNLQANDSMVRALLDATGAPHDA